MALLNPTLTEAGPTPGAAEGWTVTSFCSAERLAAFGPAPVGAREDFERWTPFLDTFPEGGLVLAFFDALAEGLEDVEEGWMPGVFMQAFSEALLDACSFGGSGVEKLTTGWLGGPFAMAWSDTASLDALFNGVPSEAFEAWLPSAVVAFASCAFDAGTKSAETFAGVGPAMTTA